MSDLPHVIVGDKPSEELIRITEAYLREHDMPTPGTFTAALCNTAIDWWNTLPVEEWEPGRWYRVCQPDGTLWMETSSRKEAEAEAKRTGWPLERLYVKSQSEWRQEPMS